MDIGPPGSKVPGNMKLLGKNYSLNLPTKTTHFAPLCFGVFTCRLLVMIVLSHMLEIIPFSTSWSISSNILSLISAVQSHLIHVVHFGQWNMMCSAIPTYVGFLAYSIEVWAKYVLYDLVLYRNLFRLILYWYVSLGN